MTESETRVLLYCTFWDSVFPKCFGLKYMWLYSLEDLIELLLFHNISDQITNKFSQFSKILYFCFTVSITHTKIIFSILDSQNPFEMYPYFWPNDRWFEGILSTSALILESMCLSLLTLIFLSFLYTYV